MSVFIALATALTLLVLYWLARPLFLHPRPDAVSSDRLNAAIYREQLQALERDLACGALSPQDYESTRDELQRRLLDDTAAPAAGLAAPSPSFWSARRTAGALALLLPLLTIAMYLRLGQPSALQPAPARGGSEAEIAKMVETLAARLQTQPDDPKGWAMLARSYKVLGRLQEAEQAFMKTGPALGRDPDLLTDYAELLALRADHRLQGRPQALIEQALALDPSHPTALMMAGAAAYQRKDYAAAVGLWQRLRAVLEPGSEDAQLAQAYIDEAQARLKPPATRRRE